MSWRIHAGELADWTLANWARRRDCYGGYHEDEYGAIQMTTWHRPLYRGVLAAHYAGYGCPVGLHDCDADGRGNRISVDVDAHSDAADPAKNWSLTLQLLDVCRQVGLEPIVEDSNGAGGYHLRIWLAGERPTGELLGAGRWLVDRAGLPAETEVFPKQERPSKYGSWLRLPGRHHRRDHWSRFWVGGEWIGDDEACRYLLGAQPQASDLPEEAWGYRRVEQVRRDEEAERWRLAAEKKHKAENAAMALCPLLTSLDRRTPSERFNAANPIESVLERYDWRERREGEWSRPGSEKVSGRVRDGKIWILTFSVEQLKQYKTYCPFGFWAAMEHGNDWSAASKQFLSPKKGEKAEG